MFGSRRPNGFRSVLFPALLFLGGLSLAQDLAGGEDWPKYRHDLANTGLSGETGISSSNVNSLTVKWKFDTGNVVSASPAVATVNGQSVVYVGSWDGTFHALDAVTGTQLWSFHVDAVGRCTSTFCPIGSSAAVANGVVYFGAHNGYVYALDAASGSLLWKVQPGDPTQTNNVIWSSPVVYNGVVFIGVASWDDDPCVIGQVVALNASTGAIAWRFATIDQTTCPDPNAPCVGAGVWSSAAIDIVNNILYIGTGNPGSTCSNFAGNAGLYPDSILAFNASSGALLNYFQAVPNDTQDVDFGSSALLHSTFQKNTCSGVNTSQDWVSEASKNYYLYTLERGPSGLTGSPSQQIYVGGEVIASPGVASQVTSSVCDPGSGLTQSSQSNSIFVPQDSGSLFQVLQDSAGATSAGFETPSTGTNLFSAAALIQDLVFFGGDDKKLHAVRQSDGTEVWSYTMGDVVDSGPAISNGRIYVGSNDHFVYCFYNPGGAAAASLSPTSVSFGNQQVSTTSTPQAVTLSNTGNVSLSITSIAITGTNGGDFAQTNNCGSSVAIGASCTINVTFMPTASGTRSGTLTVTDNAGGSPQNASLTGTGVSGGGSPAASLSPTSLSFANQNVGTTSAAQTVTLSNSGGAALSISTIAVTGTNSGDFAPSNNCGSTLAAGASCTVNVTFRPTASGTRTATLSFTDNASGSPQTVSLTGTGATQGTIALVSKTYGAFGGDDTQTASSLTSDPFPAPAGDLIVAYCGISGAAPLTPTISDSAHNVFAQVDTTVAGSGGDSLAMYYAVAQGSSSDTVTCTWGAAQNSLAVMVQVYSGVDPNSPLDATASGNVQGGTSLQTNPFSTASASEVMVAGMMSSGCNPPPTAGSGYILELNATPSVCGGPVAAAEDAIVSVRQTNVSASMTVPSGTYADMIVATFRAAP